MNPMVIRLDFDLQKNEIYYHSFTEYFKISNFSCEMLYRKRSFFLVASSILMGEWVLISNGNLLPSKSIVFRACHRYRKSLIGWIFAGGPIVDGFFSTVSDLNFYMCTISTRV